MEDVAWQGLPDPPEVALFLLQQGNLSYLLTRLYDPSTAWSTPESWKFSHSERRSAHLAQNSDCLRAHELSQAPHRAALAAGNAVTAHEHSQSFQGDAPTLTTLNIKFLNHGVRDSARSPCQNYAA